MKRFISLLIIFFLSITASNQCSDDTLDTTYSGTYCLYDYDYSMEINRSGSLVSFTLTADDQIISGWGSVSGTGMTLNADVGTETMTINITFADDENSFTGEYTLTPYITAPFNGASGDCIDNYPAGDIELAEPYEDISHMDSIARGFGCDITSAWEDHSGLDIVPAANLMPFLAMASGKVIELNATRHSGDGNWITSVVIKYNSTYRVLYAFENLTSDDDDRDTQLEKMNVAIGQMVSQGDIIGWLHTVPGTYYHVHISLIKNLVRICPDPYLTDDARTGLTDLVHITNPALGLCAGCE